MGALLNVISVVARTHTNTPAEELMLDRSGGSVGKINLNRLFCFLIL